MYVYFSRPWFDIPYWLALQDLLVYSLLVAVYNVYDVVSAGVFSVRAIRLGTWASCTDFDSGRIDAMELVGKGSLWSMAMLVDGLVWPKDAC